MGLVACGASGRDRAHVSPSLAPARGEVALSRFELQLTYIGGPTALVELGGLRLLTDPTFDPGGTEYPRPGDVLRKTQGPAVSADAIGTVDVVLLSHDHHPDNLDHAGQRMLGRASKVLTTKAGAGRLGGNAVGLVPWQSEDLPAAGGRTLRVTATPARHGPADGDRGPVVGFALAFADDPESVVYVSGDTVWYEGVEEIARRWSPLVAVLFMGAARVLVAGPSHLTMTAAEAVCAAAAFPQATIVPLHFEGWAHFTESRPDIERAFEAAGLRSQLRWPEPGRPVALPPR
jgi:L-ascorbate metabolism protein UlaG (beta-lactamase superfamily)